MITDLTSVVPASQIDPAMASEDELTQAIANHENKTNPHPQYQLPVTIVQQSVAAPAQISLLANTWFDLGIFSGVNSGSTESLFAAVVYIQYTLSGQDQPYWQYSGSILLSPVWWKAGGAQLTKYIDMEGHNAVDFTLNFRLGLTGQGNRMVQLYPPIALTARLIRASFVRLRY